MTIRENLEQWEKDYLSPYASLSVNSKGRLRPEEQCDIRPVFQRDRDRIIHCKAFRRLKDKTQVFPLDQSDFVRTRLTHSLEVSSFAKSLGQNIGEYILAYGKDPEFTPQMKEDICNILLCAGLIHDIGNPPFGHFGETTIREWFEEHLDHIFFQGKPLSEVLTPRMKADLYYFEGKRAGLPSCDEASLSCR